MNDRNNTTIEIRIDLDKLPESIVPKTNQGYRNYELDDLPKIEKWMLEGYPSYDPDQTSNKIITTITGKMPNWLAIWIGMKIGSRADDVLYKPLNSPSFYLKKGAL